MSKYNVYAAEATWLEIAVDSGGYQTLMPRQALTVVLSQPAIGSEHPNVMRPGKRMLSTMTPTMAFESSGKVMVLQGNGLILKAVSNDQLWQCVGDLDRSQFHAGTIKPPV